MFEQYVPCLSEDSDDGEHNFVSPMQVAATAARQFLRTKIRNIAETKSGKRDGVGVLLYGCDPNRAMRATSLRSDSSGDDSDDSEEREELPSTHELIQLAPPGIEQVLSLQECLPPDNPNQTQRNLRKEFSSGKIEGESVEEEDGAVCSLLQGLTAAMKVFANAKCVKNPTPASKQLPDSKAIWIFTNQDDPCHGDEAQKSRINMVRKDCREAEIAIHILPLPKKSSEEDEKSGFDQSIFYNDLTDHYKRVEDVEYSATEAVDIDAFVEKFEMGTKKRRRYATVPLLLPGWKERKDNPGIMLDLYGVVQVRNKPQKVSVHQENNTMTNRKTKRLNKETAEEVSPEDIHHFVELCGNLVSVQPANLATMKRASNSIQDGAGLLIHGFRPMKLLPTTKLLSRNVLALANDSRVQGSGKALYNLKQSMKKKGVFAVGELLVRATATSQMVALVPKNDEFGEFFITQLPYKEDTRAVLQNDIGFADPNSVDAAKGLISKSTLHFEDFVSCLPENPWLKHFFGYLESVSLGKPLGEVEDDAKMDIDRMMETASEEIESFSLSLPEDELPVKMERKRKAASSTSKQEFVKDSISGEWIDMYKNDEVADQKNDVLKAFLKSQGERLAGKKTDLVDRVHRCIQKELFKE